MRFSDYHPGIHLCFFTAVLAGTILFRHPVYLALSFLAALLWWVEQKEQKDLDLPASLWLSHLCSPFGTAAITTSGKRRSGQTRSAMKSLWRACSSAQHWGTCCRNIAVAGLPSSDLHDG